MKPTINTNIAAIGITAISASIPTDITSGFSLIFQLMYSVYLIGTALTKSILLSITSSDLLLKETGDNPGGAEIHF